MLVTVFLSVLVAALALGNLFLYFTNPKRWKKQISQPSNTASPMQFQQPLEQETSLDSFEETADRERARMLNKRIDRLEKLLLKTNNSEFLAQKLNGTNLAKKLNSLEDSRQNTRIEIAALKQRLDALQVPKKGRAPKGSDISDERLRELVYRTR